MMLFVTHNFKQTSNVLLYCLCLCRLEAAQDLRVPPSITRQGIHCLYKEGDMCVYRGDGEVIIECEASGFPDPVYKWYKTGVLLDLTAPNIKRQGTGGIIISRANSLDEGYYQCRAENAHGAALGTTFQLVKARLCSYPPDLPIHEYSARPGEPLKINCNPILSVPSAQFTWAIATGTVDKYALNLDFSQRVNIDPFGNLYFTHVKDSDGDKLYKCKVYNAQLDLIVGGSLSTINILELEEAPLVKPSRAYSTASPHVALVGKDMVVQCLFRGNPAPSVTWDKVKGQLPQGRIELKSFKTQLKIKRIRVGDEGMYMCTGSNTAGRDAEVIFVQVEAVPVFSANTNDLRPMNTNATNDEDVTFNCKPYAIPMGDTRWFMNGVPIDAGNPPERMSISADRQSLTINKVCKDCVGERATDLMVIQCNTSNIHGYAFGEGYLNPLLPTVITLPPPVEVEVNIGIVLELPCHATSDDSTPVMYQWLLNDQRIILNPPYTNIDKHYTLFINTTGLGRQNWKEYTGKYTCTASNGYTTMSADCMVKPPPALKYGFSISGCEDLGHSTLLRLVFAVKCLHNILYGLFSPR